MSQTFGSIKIPDVRVGFSGNQPTDKQLRYRGIFVNLLAQQMLLGIVKDMRGTSQCDKTELNNMVVDIVGTTAARS